MKLSEKQSIIDVRLTKTSSVHNFEVLPYCLGVNPQSCHKVLSLAIKLNLANEAAKMTIPKTENYRFCSYGDVVEVRGWVADRSGDLPALRPDDMSVYKYTVLCRLYHFAKTRCVGMSTKTLKSSSAGKEVER